MSKAIKSRAIVSAIGVTLLFVSSALQSEIESAHSRESAIKPSARKHEEREPTDPGGALRFRRSQLQDEKGYIPPDGLEKARRHVEQMRAAQNSKLELDPNFAGIKPDSWTWMGPGNVGGRIRAIVIHPTNPNNMWVGSVSGGIWRSTNAGASWQPVDDFMASLAVSTMLIHPTDPNRMYAGTGEGFGNTDALQGAGIFRSTDGGVRWDPLGFTSGNVNFNFVNRLAFSPNGVTLLAATNTGVWRSIDGGDTWTRETFNQAVDVDFHPTNNARAIVGELGAVRFTTNGGDTWAAATFNPAISNGGTAQTNGRVELAYARSDPSIVYASVNNNNGRICRSTDGESTNGQQTFNSMVVLSHLGDQGWYDNAIWVNPRDSNNVIVGGIHLWSSSTGGSSFCCQISDGSNSAHADHHVIVEHPGFDGINNRRVYFGNDGGIYRTDDVVLATESSGWVNMNNNLGITQFYGAAANSLGVFIGGTQDNGTVRNTSSTSTDWFIEVEGDGGYCAADLLNAGIFYGEYIYLQIYRSGDGGSNFNNIFNGITDAGNQTPNPQRANFIAPFVLDPINSDTILAGGLSLWRSNNVRATTPTWAQVPKPNPGNSLISAIVISPSNSSFVLVGHNNGDIYRTFDGTAATPTWTKIDPPIPPPPAPPIFPDRFVTRLVIDNTRTPNWIYAAFGGFNPDNVYRSTDLGNTWTDITGVGVTGLPAVPVRTLVYHPRFPNFLYVGTEVGIFTSEDAGATWETPQNGPANVSVDELFWYREGANLYPKDLIAATHGRGLYRASFGVYVDCNYLGTQLGTESQPYRTITAAINATTRYQTIWIRPCTYLEAITTDKRLEMRTTGGPVIIRPGN